MSTDHETGTTSTGTTQHGAPGGSGAGPSGAGRRRLLRAELRKLTSTRMPWAFVIGLAAFAGINAVAVVFGTDADGSKAFVSTAADQQSLIAFATNALLLGSLFGTLAVAREYGHGTVVPTFLAMPVRWRSMLATYAAAGIGGAVLGLVGVTLTTVAVAATLPTTEFGFLVGATDLARVVAASVVAGAAGALVGAGIGAVVRNSGGAAVGTFVALVIAPPLFAQLAAGIADWIPGALAGSLAGVSDELSPLAAVAGLAVWALVPMIVGLLIAERSDVV